jgi:hypothetical protein
MNILKRENKDKNEESENEKLKLQEIILSAFEKKDEQQSISELELSKIIVQEITSNEKRKIFTNIDNNELYDLRKAIILNHYFRNKQIDEYIKNTLELKLSISHLLIDKMVEIVGRNTEKVEENKGLFRFLKR